MAEADFARIARMNRKRLDRHEAEMYEGDGRGQFDDPDGGLLRYGRALRRVLSLCDKTLLMADIYDFRDRVRHAIAYELGITQGSPEGSDPRG